MHRSLSVSLICGSLFMLACSGDGYDDPASRSDPLASAANTEDGGASPSDACAPAVPHAPYTTWSPITDAQVPVTFGDPNSSCNTFFVHCPPTKGPIPEEAFSAPGDSAQFFDEVPDFVTTLGGKKGEPVGYVSRYDLLCGHPDTMNVLDDSLTKVVGQMVAGVGFVPAKH